jgi:hypothetical protein
LTGAAGKRRGIAYLACAGGCALLLLVAARGTSVAAMLDGERSALAVPHGAGPALYDQVWVRRYGPDDAGHVLVLIAGSPSGQGNFDWLATQLVASVPNLQVWSYDRRENALEDVTGFLAGDPDDALGYYFLGEPVAGRTFARVAPDDAPFVRQWGLELQLSDLRTVVLAARAGGSRSVILGGHSMGAITAPTYAAWDFDGAPGYRDLEALVMIDGAPFGAFAAFVAGTPFAQPWQTVKQAQAALDALERQSPFNSAGPSSPIPEWIEGVAPELACEYAVADPAGESVLQPLFALVYPLPDFPLTNEAFLGVVISQGLASTALKARVGKLARSGLPRPWVNGPDSSVPAFCAAFIREPGNSMEWYYPVRLDMDLLLGVPDLRRTRVTDALGLHPYHLDAIDLPIYVFETGISQGGVLRAARRLMRESRIRHATLVSDPAMGHVDPLVDVPAHNRFLLTVVPFLRRVVTSAH